MDWLCNWDQLTFKDFIKIYKREIKRQSFPFKLISLKLLPENNMATNDDDEDEIAGEDVSEIGFSTQSRVIQNQIRDSCPENTEYAGHASELTIDWGLATVYHIGSGRRSLLYEGANLII